MDDISRFDTSYQKQLLFNFSATRATRKKSAAMINVRASRLRDIDLDVASITFSRDTTDHHELSRYIFEDLLSCFVGSWIIVCIRLGVEGDPTETSYSDQAKCITSCRNESGIATESSRMAGDQYLICKENSSAQQCDVVSAYLLHAFLSCHVLKYDERMRDVSPGDLLCVIVSVYKKFLTDTLDSTNEHAKLIVNFLLVSGDFLDFVSIYQNQDSIMVEVGYKMFVLIWKLLGQNKYLEATWEQMDVLYHNFRYSQLQEVRINCQVWTYPGKSGKSALAQNEWLELNNNEFSNNSTVQTLDGMTRQGNYIRMTQQCKKNWRRCTPPGI